MQNTEVSVYARLPGLRGRIPAAITKGVQVHTALPRLRALVHSRYNSDTPRPIVNDSTVAFQQARTSAVSQRAIFQQSLELPVSTRSVSDVGLHTSSLGRALWQQADALNVGRGVAYQRGVGTHTALQSNFQNGVRRHAQARTHAEPARQLPTAPVIVRYQEAHRDRRNLAAVRFEVAAGYSHQIVERGGQGLPLFVSSLVRYQDAMRPPVGVRPFVPPDVEKCYDPTQPPSLIFSEAWDGSGHLLFTCDRIAPPGPDPEPEPGATIVVPIREVYLTINSAVLVRVDNGHFIPTVSMGVSLDTDSWTWGFNASVPGHALSSVSPNSNGDPVVVQATLNGTALRFVVESIARDRTFNNSQLSIRGRGLGAELDAPYAPSLSFRNANLRTARQLLDDVLTYNGVPIGWDVGEFGLTDWVVPAGVFNHNGSYISALNAIAGSVAGYIQPHNTARTLDVKLRYPTPSWTWREQSPDIEIPAEVASQEGFEWVDKPVYNQVYVSGQEHGCEVRYRRDGTAGDLLAPTVIDPLITHADAGRQRGRAIISDTGRIATVTLRIPLLSETGIIKPGNLVRYVEGGVSHVGMSRAVSVAVNMPTIYQTVTLETHVEPV